MDTDGSRSINEKQENDHNDHKVGKVLLAPLIWLNKGLTALLKSVLGANYADVTEDEVRDLVDALANDDDEDGIEENSAQMINNTFLINHGNIQQKLGVIRCLFKKRRKYFI